MRRTLDGTGEEMSAYHRTDRADDPRDRHWWNYGHLKLGFWAVALSMFFFLLARLGPPRPVSILLQGAACVTGLVAIIALAVCYHAFEDWFVFKPRRRHR
jgi:hypothetical protein